MSTTSERRNMDPRLERLWDFGVLLTRFMGGVFREIGLGIWNGTLHYPLCCGFAVLAGLSIATHADFLLWKAAHLGRLYPHRPLSYWLYCSWLMSLGFLVWGAYRSLVRVKFLSRLRDTFANAGLKTRMGKPPSFISDRPLDGHTRKLRLHAAGLPLAEFERARDALQMNLHVYIDEMKTHITQGTIDILYSHYPMEEKATVSEIGKIPGYRFMVGITRSGPLYVSLVDVPHLLIGGYTNSGKSSFLRQLFTTLYLNNPATEFTMIDLKGGVDFQFFENLKRVTVYRKIREAIVALKKVEGALDERMALLRANRCENIAEFSSLPEDKRVYPEGWLKGKPLHRHVVMVDEAADLFMAGTETTSKEVQTARRMASRIAALGRAIGVHIVIATQRPDRNAIDPLTKTNLQGRLCYQMADNASSMTILDAVRAADLPKIPGRAIWRNGAELLEVQTPWLTKEEADTLLAENRTETENAQKAADSGETAGSTDVKSSLDSEAEVNALGVGPGARA